MALAAMLLLAPRANASQVYTANSGSGTISPFSINHLLAAQRTITIASPRFTG